MSRINEKQVRRLMNILHNLELNTKILEDQLSKVSYGKEVPPHLLHDVESKLLPAEHRLQQATKKMSHLRK